MSSHAKYGTDLSMNDMVVRLSSMFKTERLVIRSMEDNDETRGFLMELFADPTIRGLSEFGSLTPVSKKAVDKNLESLMDRALIAALICLPAAPELPNDKAKPIGYISISPKWEHGASIGICIASDFQDKGYGREVLNWAIDWSFRWGKVHRLAIGTIAFNERAAKLYASLGFTLEGKVRGAAWSDGAWHDLLEFSMLDYEWRELRGEK